MLLTNHKTSLIFKDKDKDKDLFSNRFSYDKNITNHLQIL